MHITRSDHFDTVTPKVAPRERSLLRRHSRTFARERSRGRVREKTFAKGKGQRAGRGGGDVRERTFEKFEKGAGARPFVRECSRRARPSGSQYLDLFVYKTPLRLPDRHCISYVVSR